jgi:hypothetical protein
MTWQTDSGYSPHAFYITSTDEGGRCTIRVNVPSHIAAEMAALIQSGKLPDYRTKEDIVRDALVHRLEFIQQLIGDARLERALVAERRQADIDRRQRGMDRADRYVSSLEAQLRAAHANGDMATVREIIEEHDPAHLDEPYRRRALTALDLFKHELGDDQW